MLDKLLGKVVVVIEFFYGIERFLGEDEIII